MGFKLLHPTYHRLPVEASRHDHLSVAAIPTQTLHEIRAFLSTASEPVPPHWLKASERLFRVVYHDNETGLVAASAESLTADALVRYVAMHSSLWLMQDWATQTDLEFFNTFFDPAKTTEWEFGIVDGSDYCITIDSTLESL